MKELNSGDLVRCYGNPKYDVLNPMPDGDTGMVNWIDGCGVYVTFVDRSIGYVFHRKQVRLITRKKVAPITMAQLKEAWNKPAKNNMLVANMFYEFIEELERIIGREIK